MTKGAVSLCAVLLTVIFCTAMALWNSPDSKTGAIAKHDFGDPNNRKTEPCIDISNRQGSARTATANTGDLSQRPKRLERVPLSEALRNRCRRSEGNHNTEQKISLLSAACILHEFFIQNGPHTGVAPITIAQEHFLQKLRFTEKVGDDYEFIFEWEDRFRYRAQVSALDGSLQLLTLSFLQPVRETQKVDEELARHIALAFLSLNYPNFAKEEFTLARKRRGSCWWQFLWRRKKQLPGYFLVYPSEVTVRISDCGLIDFYSADTRDWKVREPPKVSKEEAIKIAKRLVQMSGFDKLDFDNPEVLLRLAGSYANPPTRPATLFWNVFFRTSKEFREEQYAKCNYDIPHGREILIDAYTGEVLDDATRC